MIQADRLDADLHFAFGGRRRVREIDQFKLAVADELKCAHGGNIGLF
jgi:hypothetical protein